MPLLGLVWAEARLIAEGRLWLLLAVLVAAAGFFVDYRLIASPAALLLLIFGLTAHAGRSEQPGLIALTRTAPYAPMLRRLAFVAAGLGWSLLLALPAAVALAPSRCSSRWRPAPRPRWPRSCSAPGPAPPSRRASSC